MLLTRVMTGKAVVTTIRAAQADDLPAIVELENNCFSSEAWAAEDLEACLQESLGNDALPLHVAFGRAAANDNETPAGYCLGRMAKRDQGEILSLAVNEDFRGMKLGRELLERVCSSLRNAGAQNISLEVKTGNLPAIALYEKAGFQKTRTLKHYYPDGSDAYRMMRRYMP